MLNSSFGDNPCFGSEPKFGEPQTINQPHPDDLFYEEKQDQLSEFDFWSESSNQLLSLLQTNPSASVFEDNQLLVLAHDLLKVHTDLSEAQ